MCNTVINWRQADRARSMQEVAAGFAKLIADGLAAGAGSGSG
jgi:hypothetical protein